MKWYLKCINHYGTFSGRAHRTEYWNFVLVHYLIYICLGCLHAVNSVSGEPAGAMVFLVGITYSLFILVPFLAVKVRRLHDMNLTGWWFLINFLPFGQLVFLVMMMLSGTDRRNRFGGIPIH